MEKLKNGRLGEYKSAKKQVMGELPLRKVQP